MNYFEEKSTKMITEQEWKANIHSRPTLMLLKFEPTILKIRIPVILMTKTRTIDAIMQISKFIRILST